MIRRRRRSRSVWNQIGAVILHPQVFFSNLPPLASSRQWLWVALIVLALVGFSAVQQAGDSAGTGVAVPAPDGPGAPSDTAATWGTALIAASGLVLEWVLQTLFLAEASLLSGIAPRFGKNWQIAVWASLPLGFMAVLQMLYHTVGGSPGEPGLAGLVLLLPGYARYPMVVQQVLLSLGSRLTIFWLWNLFLLYAGARYSLPSRWWAAAVAVVSWAGFVILVPVVVAFLGTVA